MNPQRTFDNEISNNGLRERVTECRKRLRESRVMSRLNAKMDLEEVFPEAGQSARAPFSLRTEAPDNVTAVTMEEEVGIT